MLQELPPGKQQAEVEPTTRKTFSNKNFPFCALSKSFHFSVQKSVVVLLASLAGSERSLWVALSVTVTSAKGFKT